MGHNARYYTAAELSARGRENIPDAYDTAKHLIYSSPATLAYNSPGAEGFGVKRAGLAIPGSVMLIVSPGCCGRNTSAITQIPGYRDRFFYLEMDETDLVTGRHLKRIPEAARELVNSLRVRPSLLMICITCVDALLGTDMERVAKKAEAACGIPVRPCYMYALTREGRKPPMVHVRQSLYSILEKRERKSTTVNILGFFAPLEEDCELPRLLRAIGIRKINQISTVRDMADFMQMAEANFNIVLNPEARPAAEEMTARLGIPFIELTRLCQIDQIEKQYTAFGQAIGYELHSPNRHKAAEEAVHRLQAAAPDLRFSIGEAMNGNPFELALALVRYGFRVEEIFGNPAPGYYVYIDALAALSPETRIYSNMDPSMLWYREGERVDVTIGKDAAFYHPRARHVFWNADVQPFGYAGVEKLFGEILAAVTEGRDIRSETAAEVVGRENRAEVPGPDSDQKKEYGPGNEEEASGCDGGNLFSPEEYQTRKIRGFRRYLTPFAPDQSGAEAVLYDMGGIVTILDAGGCTGNICGFDEPRWESTRSAVFSAGLRDMDAIMGRDKLLVRKLAETRDTVDASFAAVIGTPVPGVIGTDYRALSRMAGREMSLPVLTVDTNGMDRYDRGEEKAYLALFQTLTEADATAAEEQPAVGVIGLTPLETASAGDAGRIGRKLANAYPGCRIVIYGEGASVDDVRRASRNKKNLVVSPAGLAAARYLRETFGTPYEVDYPVADEILGRLFSDFGAEKVAAGQRILIVHQQVLANALRGELENSLRKNDREETAPSSDGRTVVAASWFMLCPELQREGDVRLREEDDFIDLVRNGQFDVILADPTLERMVCGWQGRWIPLHHFAVSGQYQ